MVILTESCVYNNLQVLVRVFLVLAILCLVTGAMADTYVGGLPLTTVQAGTVSGGVYMDAENTWWSASPGVQEVEKTFAAIPGADEIEWARLYVGVYVGHMQNNYPGSVEVEFDGDGDAIFDDLSANETLNVNYTFAINGGNNNSGFSGHDIGEPYKMVNEHCIRVSSDYLMWYDIDSTDITSTEPMAHVTTSGDGIDGRIKLITLVIAYNDGDTDKISYWVNQGQDTITYYDDSDTPGQGETGFSEFDLSGVESVESANLMVNHMASSDGYYWWLGEQLDRPAESSSQGTYFGWNRWDLTDNVDPGYANDLLYDRSCDGGSGEYSGQFFKIALAILTVEQQETTEPPVANFTATPLSGEPPLTVQFTDESTNTPTSWKWEYRLGTGTWKQFATTQHPGYAFNSVGTYTIRLTATNEAGNNIKTKSGYLTVNAPATCDLTLINVRPLANTVFAREPNSIRTTVKNIGGSASTATTLMLNATDGFSGTTDVPALESNEQAIITIVDTTVHDLAGGPVTFTATVDPGNTVTEATETNNVMSSSAYTVKYNGYKGKRYWEGGSDVTTKRSFDLHGDLLYSTGDSTYHSGAVTGTGWSAYTVTWTITDLPLPSGASVREARLYVPYTWDSSDEVPERFHLTFNGNALAFENHYEDVSNFGGYADYDYGLLTYNVTSLFNPSGNIAYISKDSASTAVSMYGVTLAVVYEDTNATRKQIFLNEEFDLLGASENDFGTTEEEATAYVPFTSLNIFPEDIISAELTTFVPSGNMNEGDLLYNGVTIATDVWDFGSISGPQVAVDIRNVKPYLTTTDNIVGIRSTAGATPCMAASQQFLVLTYSDAAPSANFLANTTSGTAPLPVHFSDESSGSITSYAWDFDHDGIIDSTLQNPDNAYSAAGTYTVNLTVTGPGGSDTEVKTNYITVTAAPVAPVAGFTVSTTNGVSPLSVTFTDASTNAPTSWKWEYRNYNGSWEQFSTVQNPVYSFTTAGTYDIRLTATNDGGSDDETRAHLFAVSAGHEPLTTAASGTVSGDLYVVAFQPVPWVSQPASGVTSRDFDQTFSFPASAIGNIQWARLFVNTYSGSASNAYGHRATISFDGDGDSTYESTLGIEDCDIAAESNGNSYPLNDHVTKVFSDYEAWYDVTGLITATNPAAHIRTEQISGKTYDGRLKAVTLVVAYNDGDSDQVMYWVNHGQDWINAGTTQTTFSTQVVTTGFTSSVGKNLAISSKDGRYSFSGVSQVWADPISPVNYFEFKTWDVTDEINPGSDSTLVYSMGTGTSFKTTLSTLTVAYTTPPQVADFTANTTSGTAPLPVQFTDNSTGSITSYAWDFTNDGTVDSTLQNPVYTYAAAGSYTANLTVSGAGGSDSEVKSNYITVTGSSFPDLQVTFVTTNGDELFAQESNSINATVRNNGTTTAGAFTVQVNASGDIYTTAIEQLSPGEQVNVQVTDTLERDQGDVVSITATADSGDTLAESDEGNNSLTITKTVVNNGYKGKRYTSGSDLTTRVIFEGRVGLVYSAGDSSYKASTWSSATANWTLTDLPIPEDATVLDARLYQGYTFDQTAGGSPVWTMQFNGQTVTPDITYTDRKGYGTYNYPSGICIYNVTELFSREGNTLSLIPGNGNRNGIYGSYLVVIYQDQNEPVRKIWINEECDLLYAGTSRFVSNEEATAYIPFTGADVSGLSEAKVLASLFSANEAGKSAFLFNGQEYGDFSSGYLSGPQVTFQEFDVTGETVTGENTALFRSVMSGTSGDNMVAAGAVFIAEYEEIAPVAAFTANTTSGTAPLPVQFTDNSIGSITSYAWDFTNDGTVDSTLQNPVYTYTATGTYTVNLTVIGAGGSDSNMKSNYITVTSAPVAPVADFTANTTSGTAPLSVQFTDTSTGTLPLTYLWNFDDGSPDATIANPSHKFMAGTNTTYSVNLTVTNSAGSSSKAMPITVYVTHGKRGSVFIYTTPSNATISIDGLIRGYTNKVVSDVPAGIRNLTLTKPGYQSKTIFVDIPAGDIKVLPPITLQPGGLSVDEGTLWVYSSPSNATIYINGAISGYSNQFVHNVPAGMHNLTLTKAGYQTKTIFVEVPAGNVKILPPITLKPDAQSAAPGIL